jgi:protein-S-isoprenylcysteine O-methyltransferase Ste14
MLRAGSGFRSSVPLEPARGPAPAYPCNNRRVVIPSHRAAGALGRRAIGVLGLLFAILPMVYLAGFLVDLPGLPWTVGRNPTAPPAVAWAVDLGLLVSFGLVHSLLARPAVKRRLARVVPVELERSIYSIVAGAQLVLLFVAWRSLPETVWRMTDEGARALLWTGYGAGWALVLAALGSLDAAHLFGLRQAWSGESAAPERLATRGAYRFLDHPLYVGAAIFFWVHPEMSLGGTVLATVWTGYLLIGARLEERRLERELGDEFRRHRARGRAIG